jgi:hypothetical protein
MLKNWPELGTRVMVTNEISHYYGVCGEIVELTKFQSAVVLFWEADLKKAKDPERVLRAKPTCHFYLRELEEVHTTLVI